MQLKKIASAASASFLNLIYHGAGTVVHLLLLKGSMVWSIFCWLYLYKNRSINQDVPDSGGSGDVSSKLFMTLISQTNIPRGEELTIRYNSVFDVSICTFRLDQCDQMVLLFGFFQYFKFAQNVQLFCQSKFKILSSTKKTLKYLPKIFESLPKWQNFAQSGLSGFVRNGLYLTQWTVG